MSVAAISSSAAAAASRSRSKLIALEHPRRRLEREVERVDGVEELLLVLLHVLVVGQREPVEHAVQRGQPGDDARRLAAQQLGRVRVLLLRHDRGAGRPGVGHLAEAELLRRPQDDLRAQPREVGRARRGGGHEVEHEVAVGDRVDRVRRRRRRSRAPRRPGWRSVSKFTPASAPAPSGSSLVAAEHELEPARVAPEHPEVRQQVVREVDGLRALEVRVAGHRPVLVALGELHRARSGGAAAGATVSSACARVNIAMSVATWSLRERAVCSLPPTGPTISVSRRSIAMWMSSSSSANANEPSSSSACTRSQAAEQRVAVGVGDDPGRGEHRRVRARLLDVVGPEPPVEADRGVELAEDGMLWLREARHPAIMAGMEVVVRSARPEDARGRPAVSLGRAVLRRLRRRRRSARGGCWPRSTRCPGTRRAGRSAASPRRGGAVVGVLAAFPSSAGDALARRFVRLTLTHSPPWRLLPLMRHLRATGGRRAASRPSGCSTSTRSPPTPPHRRRGVAQRAARRRRAGWPRAAGLDGVALDTGLENLGARALYERAGFTPTSLRPAPDERTARARRRLGLRRLRQAREQAAAGASATRATWPSVICGKNGSASDARRDALADRELARPVAEALAVERHQVDRGQVGLGLHAELAQRRDGGVAVDAVAAAGRRTRTSRGRSPPASAHGSASPRRARPSASRYQPATRARAASMSSSRSSWARPSAQAMSERR